LAKKRLSRQAMLGSKLVQTRQRLPCLNANVLKFCGKGALHDVFSILDLLVLLTSIFAACQKHLPNSYTSAEEQTLKCFLDILLSINVGKRF
jgi:hypothetical protein